MNHQSTCALLESQWRRLRDAQAVLDTLYRERCLTLERYGVMSDLDVSEAWEAVNAARGTQGYAEAVKRFDALAQRYHRHDYQNALTERQNAKREAFEKIRGHLNRFKENPLTIDQVKSTTLWRCYEYVAENLMDGVIINALDLANLLKTDRRRVQRVLNILEHDLNLVCRRPKRQIVNKFSIKALKND